METIELLRQENDNLKQENSNLRWYIERYKEIAYMKVVFEGMHEALFSINRTEYRYSEEKGSYINVVDKPNMDYKDAYLEIKSRYERGYSWLLNTIYDKDTVARLRVIAEQKIDDLLTNVIKPQSNNSISYNSDHLGHSIAMRYTNECDLDVWNTEDVLSGKSYYYDISGTSIEQNRVPIKLTCKNKQ